MWGGGGCVETTRAGERLPIQTHLDRRGEGLRGLAVRACPRALSGVSQSYVLLSQCEDGGLERVEDGLRDADDRNAATRAREGLLHAHVRDRVPKVQKALRRLGRALPERARVGEGADASVDVAKTNASREQRR